ncbi:MAG: hypothetical protein Ct9H300mP8_08190 [Gammaproteobacteria bacterium]|nr:MAG: hypothetical protein Ct9H300mP8_08190 [Gammaproteobacteria bacterium]
MRVLTAEYDDFSVSSMEELIISPDQCREAYESLTDSDKKALDEASARIRFFHETQTTNLLRSRTNMAIVLGTA